MELPQFIVRLTIMVIVFDILLVGLGVFALIVANWYKQLLKRTLKEGYKPKEANENIPYPPILAKLYQLPGIFWRIIGWISLIGAVIFTVAFPILVLAYQYFVA